MIDFNKYITKSHLKAVEKFNAELEAWSKETGENPVTLYEDAFTRFTLADVRVEDGNLAYLYDGKEDKIQDGEIEDDEEEEE